MTPESASSFPDLPEPPHRSSRLVFFGTWLVILLTLLFPAAPVLGLQGGFLLAMGTLMLVRPARVALPRWLVGLAVAFLVLSAAALLPKSWFGVAAWRQGLEAAGLNTGNQVSAHPQQTSWQWLHLTGLVMAGLYLCTHRVSDRFQLFYAWLFSFGVTLVAGTAVACQTNGWEWPWDSDPSFGFFPNRNHTATLLAVGGVTSMGCLFQSIRSKRHGLAALAALNFSICLGATLAFNVSRAGLLLLLLGCLVWLAGLGKRYFSKGLLWTGAGLAVLGIGLFYWMGGELKARLEKTVERAQTMTISDPSAAAQEISNVDATADFRLLIYRDTWRMIKSEPITGVGLGMFGSVFRQYRKESASAALCVHPESDWLMLAAEQGLVTALVLAAAVGLLFWTTLRAAWHRHAWSLRWNGVVAAFLVPLHGVFDVPGHRIGLALAALYLLVLSMREGHRQEVPSPVGRWCWRVCGVLSLILGGLGVAAQMNLLPANPITAPTALLSQARSLYAEDAAERQLTPPPPVNPNEKDKLAIGIELLDEAIRVSPLDPDLHYLKGYLALHFSEADRAEITDPEFKLQRLLSPLWVQIPMRQAEVYAPLDPKKTLALWDDALRRAEVMQELGPGTDWERYHVIEYAIYQSDKADETLKAAALELAKTDAREFVVWSHRGTLEQLNQLLPQMLLNPMFSGEQREQLLQIWQQKGGTDGVAKYRAEHP